jgi:hypothetical protein
VSANGWVSPTDTWVRFYHRLRDHPKAAKAGPAAMWLFQCSVAWSDEHGTDGWVPAEALDGLAAGLGNGKARAAAQRLVEARLHPEGCGLWEPDDGGWWIHDFTDWQPPAQVVRDRKLAARDRKRRQRASALVPRDGRVTRP